MKYEARFEFEKLTKDAVLHLRWLMDNGNMHEKLEACKIILGIFRKIEQERE